MSLLWKVTILLGLAWAASFAAKRVPASVRHLVWSLALVGAAMLPLLERAGWNFSWSAAAPVAAAISAVPGVASNGLTLEVTASSGLPWIFWVWAVGAAAVLLRVLIGLARLSWMTRRAMRIDADWSPGCEVRLSGDARMPMTWGWLRATILLPAEAEDWTAERRTAVLSHEREHVRRGDWMWLMLAQCVCALYWFHPLVWFAAKRMRQEAELSCDDAVLREGTRPVAYAEHLLELARQLKPGYAEASVALAMAQRSSLADRVESMLDDSRRRHAATGRLRAAAAAIALAVILPLSGLQAQGTGAGKLTGVVKDASGMAVPGAVVRAINDASGTMELTRTKADGTYTVERLAGGNYTIEIAKPGFKLYKKAVVVAGTGEQRMDALLALGEISESMQVTAKNPLAQPAQDAASGAPSGGQVTPVKLKRGARPVYPESAKSRGASGTVVLKAVISVEGEPLNVQVITPSVDPELAAAAIDAVKQMRYEPAKLNGHPVEVVTNITIDFRLEP